MRGARPRAKEGEPGALRRLGDLAYYQSGPVAATAVVLTVISSWLAVGLFDAVKPFGFQDPSSESAEGAELYEEITGVEPLPGVVVLVDDPRPGRLATVAARLRGVPGIERVASGSGLGPGAGISQDGESGLVLGSVKAGVEDRPAVGARAVEELAELEGVQLGGSAVASDQINSRSRRDLARAELVALPILLLLSLWFFRGLVAALLPLVVGGIAIAGSLAVLRLAAEAIDIDVFALNLVTALGLGLAIDYCLFVISRYRDELAQRGPGREAMARTMATAGRTVAFSSVTVAAALAALLIFPQRFLYSMGLGGAVVALLAGAIVLTVLPALLTLLGPRINALSLQRPRQRRAKGGWYRLARFATRQRLVVATLTGGVMVVTALPFLRVELTQADARTLPAETSARKVDAALRSDFRLDPGAAVVVLVEAGAARDQPGAAGRELARLGQVDPGAATRRDGLTRLDFQLAVRQNSDGAVAVVERARELDWGAPAFVLGPTAELVDQRQSIGDRLPLAIAIVVVVTFALLLLMTRAPVLSSQALLMNVLTVGVALGVMVLVFQDGRLEPLLDYTSDGAIDRSVPILLFAIVFGLSTDYGIFVISRIQEERLRVRSRGEAIALGVDRSARIITAAAVLLSVAIGAVVLSGLVYNKQLALGAAVGILIDATIVRALLFPAVMRLGGSSTWWSPGRLRRDPAADTARSLL